MSTTMAKKETVQRKWYVLDAAGKPLGRTAVTAANLLRHTQLQVQTVAQHCGIGDVNYFSKVFKRHFGLTPRQFREEHLAQRMGKK